MTTRTRYFMLGSFAILVAGLCTGLVAYYGGLPAGAFSKPPGPAELAYVPADAAVVGYADVREVMASEFRKRLRDVMPASESKGQEEFKQHTGIDIEQDIDHVVACMLPGADGAGNDSGFVAFRGRFNAVRLEALAREHGAAVEDYKGKRLVRMDSAQMEAQRREHEGEAAERKNEPESTAPPAHRHPRTMAMAFLEPGLIAFGEDRSVRRAIDTAASGHDVRSNTELMAMVKDLESSANAWAVGRFDLLASRARLPQEVSAQVPAIKWFALSGKVNGGVTGHLRAEARDEQAAQNLRDVVNGFLALARMQAGSKPEVQALMQGLQLSGGGKTVELSFTVPSELLDALGNRAKTRAD